MSFLKIQGGDPTGTGTGGQSVSLHPPPRPDDSTKIVSNYVYLLDMGKTIRG